MIAGIAADNVRASDNSATVQSLDAITSQTSDIPALLTEKTIDLPDPVIPAPQTVKKHTTKPAGSELRGIRIAPTSEKETAALQQALSDAQKQIATLQQQEQSANQQLEEKTKQLEALRGEQDKGSAAAAGQQKQLAESLNSIAELKKQITDLTAKQVASSLELATEKTRDGQAITQLKKLLDDSQSQATALSGQIADLTETQTANAKALAEAKAGDSKAVADLKLALDKSQTETAALKKSLTDSQNQAAEQVKQLTDLRASQSTNEQSLADARKTQVDSQKQQEDAQRKLQEATARLDEQNKKMTALTAEKAAPASEDQLRAYALGTLWGQEVKGAMANVQSDGYSLELTQVISGVSDSIKGQFKVPESKIMAELDAMNKKAMARQKNSSVKTGDSDTFLTTFSSKPGTKRADMGYYYRILQKGQGSIAANDVVAVAVKESLSNGKVIKDMAKTGKVLALPLANFPPLFSSAISKMNKGGKLVMAVPPELAYGEQGRPPEIPPSSTMVYEITVVDVQPAAGK